MLAEPASQSGIAKKRWNFSCIGAPSGLQIPTIAKTPCKNTKPSLLTRSGPWAVLSAVEWSFSLCKTASNGNNFQIPKGQIMPLLTFAFSCFATSPLCSPYCPLRQLLHFRKLSRAVPYSNFNTHPLQIDSQGNLGTTLKTRQLRADRKCQSLIEVWQECLKCAGEEKSNRSANRWCMRQYWNHPLHHTESMTSAHIQHKSRANCSPLRKWASLFREFTKMQRLDFSTPAL